MPSRQGIILKKYIYLHKPKVHAGKWPQNKTCQNIINQMIKLVTGKKGGVF